MDKNQEAILPLFEKFIENDRNVFIFSGCIPSSRTIAAEIYFHFWNQHILPRDIENIQDEYKRKIKGSKTLMKMDSLVLFANKTNELLRSVVLENRVYNRHYQERIKQLALEHNDFWCLKYLLQHDTIINKNELKAAFKILLDDNELETYQIMEVEKIMNTPF